MNKKPNEPRLPSVTPGCQGDLQMRNLGSGILNVLRTTTAIPLGMTMGPVGFVIGLSEPLLRQVAGSHLLHHGIGDAKSGIHIIRAALFALLLTGSSHYGAQFFQDSMNHHADSLPKPTKVLDVQGASREVTTTLQLNVQKYEQGIQHIKNTIETLDAQIRQVIQAEEDGTGGTGAEKKSAAYYATQMILDSAGDALPRNWDSMANEEKKEYIFQWIDKKNPGKDDYNRKVAGNVVDLLSQYPDVKSFVASDQSFQDAAQEKANFTQLDQYFQQAKVLVEGIDVANEAGLQQSIQQVQGLLQQMQGEYTQISKGVSGLTRETNATLAGLAARAGQALRDYGIETNENAAALKMNIPSIDPNNIPTLKELKKQFTTPEQTPDFLENPENWRTLGSIGYWLLLTTAFLDLLLILIAVSKARHTERLSMGMKGRSTGVPLRFGIRNDDAQYWIYNSEEDNGGDGILSKDTAYRPYYWKRVWSSLGDEENAEGVSTARPLHNYGQFLLPFNQWLGNTQTAYSQTILGLIGSIPRKKKDLTT